jgi:hypothetical protein
MIRQSRLLIILLVISALAFWMRGSTQGAQSRETAVILPAATYTIGNSLAYGSAGNNDFGYGLSANGITDYWAAKKGQTINFVFFVFPGQKSVNQAITFKVTSPSGATVYTYTWAKAKFGYDGTWYGASAKGNYSTPGAYTATVSTNGTVLGSIPVYIAKAGT